MPVASAAEPLLRNRTQATSIGVGRRGYEFDGIQPDCLLEETALEAQRASLWKALLLARNHAGDRLGPLTNIALLLKA